MTADEIKQSLLDHEAELKARRKVRAHREYLRKKEEGRICPKTPEQLVAWKAQQTAKRKSLTTAELQQAREKQRIVVQQFRASLPSEKKALRRQKEAVRRKVLREDEIVRSRDNQSQQRWRERNPQYQAKANIRRRLNLEATTTPQERDATDKFIRKLKRIKEHRCAYCLKLITNKELHIDHIVPIARGGRHVATNLVASCARCNVSKHARLLYTEWVPPKDR